MFYEMPGKNADSAGIARDVVWFKGASSGTGEYLAYELTRLDANRCFLPGGGLLPFLPWQGGEAQ